MNYNSRVDILKLNANCEFFKKDTIWVDVNKNIADVFNIE